MPHTSERSDRTVGRFVGRADALGFEAPPGTTFWLKLLKLGDNWTIFLQAMTEVPPAKLVAWLPSQNLLRLEFGSRRVVRADYQQLPAAWARAFKGVTLDFARLSPEGGASVTVSGTRAAVNSFARRMDDPAARMDLMQLHEVAEVTAFLTSRQDEALRAAVGSGYYRIPRALNLDDLAKKLGITSASLSERLRRAEGRIITRYVESGSASPWDEKTLFDIEPALFASVVWPEGGSRSPSAARGETR